jgi:hypothetical protein
MLNDKDFNYLMACEKFFLFDKSEFQIIRIGNVIRLVSLQPQFIL